MKIVILLTAALLIGFGGGYIAFKSDSVTSPSAESQTKQYTCGMHPEIISDEPGYCPICGMKLTPKRDGGSSKGSIVIDPATLQNIGLVATAVAFRELSREVKAFGQLDYAEPMIRTVNVKIPGWVEKLFIEYEGEYIRAGQPLFEIYSPELLAAQREYLVAIKNSGKLQSANSSAVMTSSDLVQASKLRLNNWDITDSQIKKLVTKGELTKTMTFYSPYNGIITAKHINEGDYLKPGSIALKVADISKLWLIAYVYEQDLPYISVGQAAEIAIPFLPGKRYKGVISYISPYLNDKNQVEIRLDIDNHNSALKPGIYAEIKIATHLPGRRMVIPDRAVINSGNRQIVYTSNTDGSYQPNIIRTGAYGSDGTIEVVSGLNADDIVVTSGQFLLDSESRLNESLMMIQAHSGHDHGNQQYAVNNDTHHSKQAHDDSQTGEETSDSLSGIYTCPMPEHFHVLQYGKGKCSECGMNLVPVEKTENTEVYYCPMTEDSVIQNHPGRCPKCGMYLKKLETSKYNEHNHSRHEQSGDDHSASQNVLELTGIYTCPMPEHFHVLQYGKGKCPECGMNLVPVEKTENTEVYHCPMAECETAQTEPGNCPVCGMNLVKLKSGESND